MPGRTPPEAFKAFIAPLKRAASCLGPVKITVGPGLLFDARMTYRIVRDPDSTAKTWRVTTTGYSYHFAALGHDVFRLHWHPQGRSPITHPHHHLALDAGDMLSSEALKKHLPTGRTTFEDAIAWAIGLGAVPAHDDWETVLQQCQAAHLRYRSRK